MIFNTKERSKNMMLVIQTGEHLHVCAASNAYATLSNPTDLIRWGKDHRCDAILYCRNADLYSLNVTLPSNADEEEVRAALRYEASSMSNHQTEEISLSLIGKNTLPTGFHDTIAAVFPLLELDQMAANYRKKGFVWNGMTATQQLLLLYHFSEEATRDTLMLVMMPESSFIASATATGISLRNIPFGSRGVGTHQEEWAARAKRRLGSIEGQPVTLYFETPDECLYDKINQLLKPETLAMQSFEELMPMLYMTADRRLAPAFPPPPKKDPRSAGTRICILIIMAVLILCSYRWWDTRQALNILSESVARNESVAGQLKRAEAELKRYESEREGLEQIRNMLSGKNHIDPNCKLIINLLCRYKLRYTRINEIIEVSRHEILLTGESYFQEELSRFLIHFEQELRLRGQVLTSEGLDKSQGKLSFKCRIKEVMP